MPQNKIAKKLQAFDFDSRSYEKKYSPIFNGICRVKCENEKDFFQYS